MVQGSLYEKIFTSKEHFLILQSPRLATDHRTYMFYMLKTISRPRVVYEKDSRGHTTRRSENTETNLKNYLENQDLNQLLREFRSGASKRGTGMPREANYDEATPHHTAQSRSNFKCPVLFHLVANFQVPAPPISVKI